MGESLTNNGTATHARNYTSSLTSKELSLLGAGDINPFCTKTDEFDELFGHTPYLAFRAPYDRDVMIGSFMSIAIAKARGSKFLIAFYDEDTKKMKYLSGEMNGSKNITEGESQEQALSRIGYVVFRESDGYIRSYFTRHGIGFKDYVRYRDEFMTRNSGEIERGWCGSGTHSGARFTMTHMSKEDFVVELSRTE